MNVRRLRFIFVTIACATTIVGLFSCKTSSQTDAEDQSRILELANRVNRSSRDLDAANNHVQELEKALATMGAKIAELEDKDTKNQAALKELSEQKAKLEQLLADVQTLQLSSIISQVQPVPVAAAPSEQAPKANPAQSTVGTFPVAATTTATITPNTATINPTNVAPVQNPWPNSSELVIDNTLAQNRTERKNIPGTSLFSERDTTTGVSFYYHRDFWYQNLGLYIEIAQFAHSDWGARLVVESANPAFIDPTKASIAFFLPSKDGAPEQAIASFGPADGATAVRGLEKPAVSLWYRLTPQRAHDLSRAMESPGTGWRLTQTGESGPVSLDEGVCNEATRNALVEMLASINDLRSSSSF